MAWGNLWVPGMGGPWELEHGSQAGCGVGAEDGAGRATGCVCVWRQAVCLGTTFCQTALHHQTEDLRLTWGPDWSGSPQAERRAQEEVAAEKRRADVKVVAAGKEASRLKNEVSRLEVGILLAPCLFRNKVA